jgi:hypothetical protein
MIIIIVFWCFDENLNDRINGIFLSIYNLLNLFCFIG